MMLTGKMVPARRALEVGLVNELCSGEGETALLQAALDIGSKATSDPMFHVASQRIALRPFKSSEEMVTKALNSTEKMILKRGVEGNEPKLALLKVIKAGMKDFQEGMMAEALAFGKELIPSMQARAKQYLFFGERAAFNVPHPTKPLGSIKKVGVLGAGTMGSGITICLLRAGYQVILVEGNQKGLDRGASIIQGVFMRDMQKGRLSVDDAVAMQASLTTSLEYEMLGDVDLVIEAVFENMALKKEIFARLDAICPADTILCSNTSTLDIDEIASATSRPESVVGMHFFSPAHVMRLCEVIKGKDSSDYAVAMVMRLAKKIRKVAVLVGNCHGFVANRMFFKYTYEAVFMVEEGCTPEQIDCVMKKFGFAIGPFQTNDVAGLDIGYKVRQELGLTDPNKRDPSERWCGIGDYLCELGRLGQKTGKGWYKYKKGSFKPEVDQELTEILKQYRAKHGIQPRPVESFSDQEILERCLYPLINEGMKILEEEISSKPSDIDTIWANGYGFPIWRGGPMFQADEIGLGEILSAALKYEKLFPNVHYWKPSRLLESLVQQGKSLAGHWDEIHLQNEMALLQTSKSKL
mmetsp:Transcript_28512/g.37297  ORF Transcript_28512/g.37297 Transcript_28512/m.37297 type:complete len:582 (-) Transcript_28512:296-2041(-)